jgi:hypothetical protein
MSNTGQRCSARSFQFNFLECLDPENGHLAVGAHFAHEIFIPHESAITSTHMKNSMLPLTGRIPYNSYEIQVKGELRLSHKKSASVCRGHCRIGPVVAASYYSIQQFKIVKK